jgi:L-fuconolactonase
LIKPGTPKNDALIKWRKDFFKICKQFKVLIRCVEFASNVMVTEADWKNWKQENFKPYIDVVVNTFGAKRILFGSDWPVCLVAASYEKYWVLWKIIFLLFQKKSRNNFLD